MRIPMVAVAAALATLAGPITASAHAFLDSAVPAVGSTVNQAPGELRLTFTQDVVVALCRVSLASEGGAAIATSKPVGDGGNPGELHVRLAARLAPGTYRVTWHVVSVDTHPTSGSYRFTVAP